MEAKKLRVAVLMGGPSSEYEISLATGRKILQTLNPAKYLIQPVIVTKERKWLIRANGGINLNADAMALVPQEEPRALKDMRANGVDVVFIAMHGEFGEDGTVQGLLESIGVAYTGSGVLASALGMDKPRSAAVFKQAGLETPDFFVLSRGEWGKNGDRPAAPALKTFGLPLVIKPANRGSSVGVTVAQASSEVETGLADAFTRSERVIIQRCIPGTEVTCGVLETEKGTIPLQPTQIIPRESRFFDYHSKYTPGASEEITPPRLPAEIIGRIQQTALAAHQAIGCSGMSRTDMILGDDRKLHVLEINTIPGMTETSLLPQAAAAAGIPFPKLLDLIIASALRKKKSACL